MKKQSIGQGVKILFVVVASTVVLSCGKRDDQEIQQDVNTKLQNSQGYNAVTATVQDGVVTLNGTCEGDSCAAKAEQMVAGVDDVESVKNNIQADAGTDLTLRTSVQQIISKYQGVEADVARGVIVLRGTINRDQLQPLMTELQALQPQKIDNQLAIK